MLPSPITPFTILERYRCERGDEIREMGEIREIAPHMWVKIHQLNFFIDKSVSDLTRHQIVDKLTNNNF